VPVPRRYGYLAPARSTGALGDYDEEVSNMATYTQIIERVRREHGFKIHHSCWIADVKAKHGLTARPAHNRRSASYRVVPCPPTKVAAIEDALKYFGMI
jgi:23S rRNA (uracil1939-C5)-methyltransferase